MTAGGARVERGHRWTGVRVQPDRRLSSLAVVAAGPEVPAQGRAARGRQTARALVGLEEYQQRALTAHIRGGRLTARQAEKLAKTYKTGRRDGASSANSPSVTSDPDLKRARLERALADEMGTPVTSATMRRAEAKS